MSKIEVVAIGVSAGGLDALKQVLPRLPENFGASVLIVQHLARDSSDYLARYLDRMSALQVKEGEDREPVREMAVGGERPGQRTEDRGRGIGRERGDRS